MEVFLAALPGPTGVAVHINEHGTVTKGKFIGTRLSNGRRAVEIQVKNKRRAVKIQVEPSLLIVTEDSTSLLLGVGEQEKVPMAVRKAVTQSQLARSVFCHAPEDYLLRPHHEVILHGVKTVFEQELNTPLVLKEDNMEINGTLGDLLRVMDVNRPANPCNVCFAPQEWPDREKMLDFYSKFPLAIFNGAREFVRNQPLHPHAHHVVLLSHDDTALLSATSVLERQCTERTGEFAPGPLLDHYRAELLSFRR